MRRGAAARPGLMPAGRWVALSVLPCVLAIDLCGNVTVDTRLLSSRNYTLVCQVFVKAGAVLSIEPGTTVFAQQADVVTPSRSPAIIVEQGAKLIADGRRDLPITFTSSAAGAALPARGLWGGLVLCGRAPASAAASVPSLVDIPYGGNDDHDDSGILRYVRVWYAGAVSDDGVGMNGVTLAGVGDYTVLDHVEVAYSQSDGFAFVGGKINGRYLSSLFAGDDGIDIDEGYQGKLQFVYVMLDADSDAAVEATSNSHGHVDLQPRSHPLLVGATLVGAQPALNSPILKLSNGTGGDFRNLILYNARHVRVWNCGGVEVAQASATAAYPDYLYFSPSTIFHNHLGLGQPPFVSSPSCEGLEAVTDRDPRLNAMLGTDSGNSQFQSGQSTLQRRLANSSVDPRIAADSVAFEAVDDVAGDSFLVQANFKGAFTSSASWLEAWSWLAVHGKLADATDPDLLAGAVRRGAPAAVAAAVAVVAHTLRAPHP